MTESQKSAASVIICSRNRPTLLKEAVLSIIEGDELPEEIVIVDQSDDPDAALASETFSTKCVIRYVWTQTVGLSRAINLGVAKAAHDLLVFTHDDVLVRQDWFSVCRRMLIEKGDRWVITGRVLPGEPEVGGGFNLSTITDETPRTYREREGIEVLFPMNMAMYRSTFDTVGGFDERIGPGTSYPAAEDNDFCFRLLESGFCIAYEPEMVVRHRAWRSIDDYADLRYHYGRGQGAYYAKHMSLRDPYMLRRMMQDVRQRLGAIRSTPPSPKRRGTARYLLGIASGMGRWFLKGRFQPARNPSSREA